MYQGRLGAAVSAMQDSVTGFRSTNNKVFELADSLNNLADALALVGRGDESGKLLEEATTLANELKNESMHSELLNTQGDAAFYRGDYKSARSAYEQAAQSAAKAKDREKNLIAKDEPGPRLHCGGAGAGCHPGIARCDPTGRQSPFEILLAPWLG